MTGPPPAWRRPDGVDAALWAYMQSPDVAAMEHAEEATAPLARFDRAVVRSWLPGRGRILDLGCGTGRITLDLADRGYSVVAVDLATASLRRLTRRIGTGHAVLPIRADLGRLAMLKPGAFDAALLIYSTLGMVRGRANRVRVLAQAAEAVRPGGLLIVHAHNFWAHRSASVLAERFRRAGRPGPAWLDRFADVPMRYAGVPGVAIHTYRLGELRADLRSGGWSATEVLALARGSAAPLRRGWLAPAWRADGWILRAER